MERDIDATAISAEVGVPEAPDELRRLRQSIDNFDSAIIHIMAERFKITQRVGELKAELGLPPADKDRERAQIARLRQLADDAQLDPQFAEDLLSFIVTTVVRNHERIRERDSSADLVNPASTR